MSAPIAIPLLSGGHRLGLLLADTASEKQEQSDIQAENTANLRSYAELAAISIGMAQLSEKIQTDAYRALAHQIHQPLELARNAIAVRSPAEAIEQVAAHLDRARRVAGSVQIYADLLRGKDPQMPDPTMSCTAQRLSDIVSSAVKVCNRMRDPRRQILFQYKPDRIPNKDILLSEDLLEQALDIMLDNAEMYSKTQSVVGVDLLDEAHQVTISVTNTAGVFLAPDEAKRIGLSSWRTEGAKETHKRGVGIGLRVVRGIAQRHGGDFHIFPTDENGFTTARLTLPWKSDDGVPQC
jgi:K+-sensing histidine kinase KdpD